MSRIKASHKQKIQSMIEDALDKGTPVPSTKEMVEVLMEGSGDIRPALPRAAANNCVQSVRKRLDLYQARAGAYAEATNYRLQEQRKRARAVEAAHKNAALASAEVRQHNEEVPPEADAPEPEQLVAI